MRYYRGRRACVLTSSLPLLLLLVKMAAVFTTEVVAALAVVAIVAILSRMRRNGSKVRQREDGEGHQKTSISPLSLMDRLDNAKRESGGERV